MVKTFLSSLLLISTIGCAQTKPNATLPNGAYTGTRWQAEAKRLTEKEREELSNMTSGVRMSNGNSSWNPNTLRWEEEFQFSNRKGRVGPRALLPMSVARTEYVKKIEDSKWCNPSEIWGWSDGYHQYHCVPNDKGPEGRKGRIEENKEAEADLAKYEQHKFQLASDLTMRVLTDDEYKEVRLQGSYIFTRPMESYYQQDIDQRFEHALRIQEILRKAKETKRPTELNQTATPPQ